MNDDEPAREPPWRRGYELIAMIDAKGSSVEEIAATVVAAVEAYRTANALE